MPENTLMAVSAIDGRYREKTRELDEYFSEHALIRYRILCMMEYLMFLLSRREVSMPDLNVEEGSDFFALMEDISTSFSTEDSDIIKRIEVEGYGPHKRTNHDVKACELYLRDKLQAARFDTLAEWVHFGCTSEDVNNTAYALMLQTALKMVIRPVLSDVRGTILEFAHSYAELPMLSRTHGQAATPTTLGKEFAVFAARLGRQFTALQKYRTLVKLNGASGNYCAGHFALPTVDWMDISKQYIEHLTILTGTDLDVNFFTTQIEPHDTYAELFHIMMRINTILVDFCQDIWRYVSDDWLRQKPVEGEVGSSAMPHKVNPIDFEQAEKRLKIANTMFEFLARDLPISRLQRDLSDSTAEREFGAVFANCLIAYKGILRGMGKIHPNEDVLRQALREHPEVLAEAYQTKLRAIGYPEGYKALLELTRGKKVTLEDMHAFVRCLDEARVPEDVKAEMLALTPETYIGFAPVLALRVV